MKNIIITADDLGIDKDTNAAIKEGLNTGVLTSTCLLANGEAFDDAVQNVINQCSNIDIGVHLNIIEGKALTLDKKSLLTDNNGNFNSSYIKMLLNSNNNDFLQIVENEFRAQIEKILSAGIHPTYINTHVHVHSIPNIFKIVAKLAKEYSIKNIRTQAEIPYYTAGLSRHLCVRYCLNIIKNIILNNFTAINKKTLKKYDLQTNDYFIGVLYTGCMDEYTIISGVNKLPKNSTAEIIIHPSVNPERPRHYKEYQAATSQILLAYFSVDNMKRIKWQEVITEENS